MSVSTIPLWGRAWKLTVKLASGNEEVISQSGWDPEALRITFDVLQTTLPSPFWFALIKVYNLTSIEMQNLLFNATWLTLEAGYQTGPTQSSIIWDGPVLQVLFDRENVYDLTMSFNCMAGPQILEENFLNGSFLSQFQAVSKMVAATTGNASTNPTPQQMNQYLSAKAQQLLNSKQYPRGRTIFGRSTKYFGQIADDNFVQHWTAGVQQYMSEMDSGVKTKPDLIYGPPYPPGYVPPSKDVSNMTRSIIGVPRQTTFGVIFTLLLDPRLIVKVPPLLVQLDKTVIQQLKLRPPNLPGILDQNGFVIAAQVHHYGDSRGNDWATEVTGYNRAYAQNLLAGVFTAQAQGVAP